MELRDQQSRFIDEYLVDLNATQAAIRAGYSPHTAKSQASRLLTNVDVSNEISRRQAYTARKLEIRREDVIKAIAAAIELAKVQGDAGAMIRGCAELNKMLGFYRRDGNDMQGRVTSEGVEERLKTMTDEELISLIESTA